MSHYEKNRLHGKKKQYGYQERDEEKRKIFKNEIAAINPDDMVFIDETGIDNNETYSYGYAPRGERLHGLKLGYRTQRISIIGAINKKQLFAPFIFQGHCDTAIFLIYLNQVLIPSLRPGQYLFIDNASFHKNTMIQKTVEDVGCFLHYLPPYSPDFNPIEHYWQPIKLKIKKLLPTFDGDLIKTTEAFFHSGQA
jgi:transposase